MHALLIAFKKFVPYEIITYPDHCVQYRCLDCTRYTTMSSYVIPDTSLWRRLQHVGSRTKRRTYHVISTRVPADNSCFPPRNRLNNDCGWLSWLLECCCDGNTVRLNPRTSRVRWKTDLNRLYLDTYLIIFIVFSILFLKSKIN